MTIGAIPLTRGSPVAAVSHDVQPRFEPPVTMKSLTGSCHSFLLNACSASIALMTLLTIGKRRGQLSSLVLR